MKPKLSKIDKFSIVAIIAILIGVLSSFLDFGIISVFFSVTMPLIFIINSTFALYGLFKRKYYYIVGVILFLFCYPFFFQFSSIDKLEPSDSISISSFNVRSFQQPINGDSTQNATTEIIKHVDSLNADILLLQESAYNEGRKIKGYQHIFLGYRKNVHKSLLTIYSKYPIIKEGYIDFPNTLNNAIYADLKIKHDTIRIYNVHLQSYFFSSYIIAHKYNDYDYLNNLNTTITKQIEQAKFIKNHANKSNKKVIICGDFNATSYSQPYRILKKGLNDSYLSNGIGFGATYTRLNYPLRIDYFLSDNRLKVLSHNNFDLNLSDHEPIFIKFRVK